MRSRRLVAIAVALPALWMAACGSDPSPTAQPACPEAGPTRTGAQAELADAARAVVTTSSGAFTIELYPDAAPLAAANFVALARCGFYDGVKFHRVLAGFVIQAGDPQTRTRDGDFAGLGTGGPGYDFEIESPDADLTYDAYVVSMANAGAPNTNGSQFFINLADLDERLERTYTIFGRVSEGTGVVDEIGAVPVNDPLMGFPVEAVVIESIVVQPPAE